MTTHISLERAPGPEAYGPWNHEAYRAPRVDRLWPSTAGQTVLLLLAGAVLGPGGLGLLNDAALAVLDPALAVALAALGVFIALAQWGDEDRPRGGVELAVRVAAVVIVAFACTATMMIAPSIWSGMWLLIQGCGAAVLVGSAGWLLMARVESIEERRVFAIAMILLLGGIADYLSISALLPGLVAGMLVGYAAPRARPILRGDIAYLQRPLMALLLVIGGARMQISGMVWLMAAGYACLAFAVRTGIRRSRSSADVRIDDSRVTGAMFVVAIAIDGVRLDGAAMVIAMSAIALGTMIVETLATLRRMEAR